MTKRKKIVSFDKDSIKSYLDNCIRYWRDVRKNEEEDLISEEKIAIYYIDAFQSVRVSLFGEELKE